MKPETPLTDSDAAHLSLRATTTTTAADGRSPP